MAAGEGTRMKSNKSKVLHTLLNKEIIKYVKSASDFENSETIIIAGKNKSKLENLFPEVKIVEQEIGDNIPYGTGYAASLALDYIDDNGDDTTYSKEKSEQIFDELIEKALNNEK